MGNTPATDERVPHVLVVDDERDLRESLNLLLSIEGFRVSEAGTGHAALALVDSGLRPDLLLLDYRMPGLNGAQTLQQLRSREVRAPAVLLSAAREARDIAAAHRFEGVLIKPVGSDELVSTLRQVLASAAAR